MRITHPKRYAAGLPGVLASLSRSLSEMGVRRSARTLPRINQPDGFQCPSCAWPEPHEPGTIEFCENGAKAVAAEATRARCDPAFFARHSLADLEQRSERWLDRAGRLTHPMLLAEGATHYEPVAWEDALELIAQELRALASPDEAIFYTSGRTSNEAAFAYQLFVRAFGTNNLPDCSNMCHESSGSALTETIGVGKGSVTLEDIHAAELIFVVGQNPGTNHPRMLSALETAKRAGAKIVAVNPLPEAGLMRFKNPQTPRGILGRGTPLADLFLQVRLGGDLALFKGLSALVLDSADETFIAAHTSGFEELSASLAAVSWEQIETASGVTRAEIEAAAALARGSRRTIVCWAMGLTQHRDAVATIREIVNFLLLGGNIGRPGAGVCPVRGHSNVQGDRTMGIWERPTEAFLDALGKEFAFDPPRAPGFDTVEAIRAMRDGRAHVFFALGGNFAAAAPDAAVTFAALRSQRLTVQVSTKLNRSHLVAGRRALILPTLGRTDRDPAGVVSTEDSMSVVNPSRGTLEPVSKMLRSETAIVCELARRTLGDGLPWRELGGDYSAIRARIERCVPGFEDYERRLAGGGFTLPHPPRDERRFPTATGRARFTVNEIAAIEVPPGRLLLQSLRSHDQFNTTIYGLNDRYRGIRAGRRVVLVNAQDLEALGIEDGAVVDIVSEWGDGVERRIERFRTVAYPTARGCAAAYFPEANALVPLDATAEISGTPASKSVVVRLELSSAAPPSPVPRAG
jgi:molybdopterin-dependent oxidoreductase alpha subunit